jgi:histidinol-phosphate aminotransferase
MSAFSSTYDPGVQTGGDGVLALHRNENLFVGREWTVETAQRLVEAAAISSYPDATSLPLREALAEVYGVDASNVFVGNGSDEVLSDLLGLLRRSFDALSCLDVHFKVYPMLAERLAFRLDALPGRTFETGHVDARGFRGLALVDSPNGITGRRAERAELLALADDEASFLIWDNVYGEYALDEPPPLAGNIAFVRSFSKFYALAGLRIGYCIAEASVVADLLARKDAFNVNGFAQVMALEALRRRDRFAELRDELVACRKALVRELEGLGFEVPPSDFVAVLATHPRHGAAHIQAELLKRKIAVRRFSDPETENYVRITVAPDAQREQLVDALRDIVG